MSRRVEEEILKAIGMEAVYYKEIYDEVIGPRPNDLEEETFIEGIQSLKDKGHVEYHDYTTGKEGDLFHLTKKGQGRYIRTMKREGLI
jgi:hypothetical protein